MTDKTKPTKADLPARKRREAPSVAFKLENDTLEITASGDYSRFNAGIENENVGAGVLKQLTNLGSQGKRLDVEATNVALGFVDAMKPQDAAEMLLLAQMAATHQAAMMFARRLNHVENIPQQDSAERAFNKLLRSYAAQMDTLKRYRSKGQQLVRVERVTVENGGQAIVGNVEHGGRAADE
ncbi:hypothetical protein [Defluviimonas salinarum]|uniref:Uncharacterized protein n=1 Tax=Defluviimonas salinarum TaxID=2992147 RepID=A0ABT3J9I2_9RHOB|nr:hypothetical protein [Defluviimonas salinarum]MCW3784347.1 hypothetical protein [Defluviimonas salinarum]